MPWKVCIRTLGALSAVLLSTLVFAGRQLGGRGGRHEEGGNVLFKGEPKKFYTKNRSIAEQELKPQQGIPLLKLCFQGLERELRGEGFCT